MEAVADRGFDINVVSEVWLRRGGRTRRFAGVWLAIFFGVLVVTLATPPDGAERLNLAVVEFPVMIGALVMAWRWYRAGLWIGRDGIVVRTLLRDRRFALGEVGSFESSVLPSPRHSYGIRLRWAGGYPVPVTALASAGLAWRSGLTVAEREWRPTVDALNGLLASLQS